MTRSELTKVVATLGEDSFRPYTPSPLPTHTTGHCSMSTHLCWQTCFAIIGRARPTGVKLDRSTANSLLFRSTQSLLGCLSPKAKQHKQGLHTTVTCKRNSGSRPTLDDVERISKGQGAKARGTGSRRIPHRLNVEERQQYDIAKQKGFLTVKGTGYRKERKGSPLANTFRQWCDAQAKPCVVIEQGYGANAMDTVMVDVSTLRSANVAEDQASFVSSASSLGYKASQQSHRIPFTIEAWQEFGITNTKDAAGDGAAATSSRGTDAPDKASDGYDLEETQQHVETVGTSHQAEGNQFGAQNQTEKSAVNGMQEANNNSSAHNAVALPASSQKKRLASTSPLAPIWTVQAQPVFFDAERPQAKELAKAFVALQE